MINTTDIRDVLVIIPARGGSKGVPRKNIRDLAGKPLIAHSIEQALKSKKVTKVIVTTDDPEIKAVALQYGAQVIDRPIELASDTASMLPVLQHAVTEVQKSNYFPETIVLLQPTNPLRETTQIDTVIQMLTENTYDSVTTIHKLDLNPSCIVKVDSNGKTSPYVQTSFYGRRQDIEPLYVINGLIYGYKTEALLQLKQGSWCNNNGALIVDKMYSLDIDTEEDLKKANQILNKLKKRRI